MDTTEEIALVSAALSAIEQIIKAVSSARAGAVTPSEALDAITRLHDQLVASRAAADKALDEKFKDVQGP